MATKPRKTRAKRPAPRFGPYDPKARKRVRLKSPPPEGQLIGEITFTT